MVTKLFEERNVFLLLTLVLVPASPRFPRTFSCAYVCACAYACACVVRVNQPLCDNL